ncbi:hypothetical protein [Aquamicrobium zhengzhouense]|uniref:DUF3175 domain-containing protein n=1 Tax=Aquamicrobium zhengzhouense TaxID=2781738 RepID=A0ABS0SAN5_9HYPH|nr:hypothetical protein [Aquamicrobium zhengzhouense]MBI1620344.1 hypothetical protein [Aquamicrobium zhengzhouense]
MAKAQKRDHGRLRQIMGAKKKRQQAITKAVDKLALEYAQGRAASACWVDLMKAANEDQVEQR